jgi:hypothetical protein
VDSVGNRVGIGKTNPGVALDVVGATSISGDLAVATNKFTVASATGNTGIAGTLDVSGNSTIGGTLDVTGGNINQGDIRTFTGRITDVTENEIGGFVSASQFHNVMIKVTIDATETNGELRSLEYIYSSRPANSAFFISGIKKNNSNSIEPLVYRSGNTVRFGYTGAPNRYQHWKVDIMTNVLMVGTFTLKNSAFGDVTGFTLVNPSGTIFFRDITVASNVGIGTTSPGAPLQIDTSGTSLKTSLSHKFLGTGPSSASSYVLLLQPTTSPKRLIGKIYGGRDNTTTSNAFEADVIIGTGDDSSITASGLTFKFIGNE